MPATVSITCCRNTQIGDLPVVLGDVNDRRLSSIPKPRSSGWGDRDPRLEIQKRL